MQSKNQFRKILGAMYALANPYEGLWESHKNASAYICKFVSLAECVHTFKFVNLAHWLLRGHGMRVLTEQRTLWNSHSKLWHVLANAVVLQSMSSQTQISTERVTTSYAPPRVTLSFVFTCLHIGLCANLHSVWSWPLLIQMYMFRQYWSQSVWP